MEGFRSVTFENGGLGDVVVPLAVLGGFTVLFTAIALTRFEVQEAKGRLGLSLPTSLGTLVVCEATEGSATPR